MATVGEPSNASAAETMPVEELPVAEGAAVFAHYPRQSGWFDYGFHGVLFAGSLAVLFLACVFRVDGPEKVIVPFYNMPLPPTCTAKTMFGIDCPGCGMTRSFVSLAHGHVLKAFTFNLGGPLLFSMMAFQLVYRPWQLWRISRGEREFDLSNLGGWSLGALAIVMVLQWFARVALTIG